MKFEFNDQVVYQVHYTKFGEKTVTYSGRIVEDQGETVKIVRGLNRNPSLKTFDNIPRDEVYLEVE